MTKEHKREHPHAHLLRMAADDADQLFECDKFSGIGIPCRYDIDWVLEYPDYNWSPVPKPKKTVKKWLWTARSGHVTSRLFAEDDVKDTVYKIKLLWSETEFEVDDE